MEELQTSAARCPASKGSRFDPTPWKHRVTPKAAKVPLPKKPPQQNPHVHQPHCCGLFSLGGKGSSLAVHRGSGATPGMLSQTRWTAWASGLGFCSAQAQCHWGHQGPVLTPEGHRWPLSYYSLTSHDGFLKFLVGGWMGLGYSWWLLGVTPAGAQRPSQTQAQTHASRMQSSFSSPHYCFLMTLLETTTANPVRTCILTTAYS